MTSCERGYRTTFTLDGGDDDPDPTTGFQFQDIFFPYLGRRKEEEEVELLFSLSPFVEERGKKFT